MKRRLFNLAAAVSLVMMLAVVALWVRSYWRGDGVLWSRLNGSDERLIGLHAGAGGVEFLASKRSLRDAMLHDDDAIPYGNGFFRSVDEKPGYPDIDPRIRRGFQYAGFALRFDPLYDGYRRVVQLVMPLCAIALIAGILPFSWGVARWRLQRRRKCRQCPNCGYDLRATPERCPECGTAAGESRRGRRQWAGGVS